MNPLWLLAIAAAGIGIYEYSKSSSLAQAQAAPPPPPGGGWSSDIATPGTYTPGNYPVVPAPGGSPGAPSSSGVDPGTPAGGTSSTGALFHTGLAYGGVPVVADMHGNPYLLA